MKKNLPTSRCMGLKESLSFFPILCVMDILLLKYVDSISLGLLSLTIKGSDDLFPCLFTLLISIRGLTHLAEIVELLNSFHLKEAEAFKDFDLEGIFFSHLYSIDYGITFTIMLEIIEGAGNNDPNTNIKFSKKEKQICNDDLVT